MKVEDLPTEFELFNPPTDLISAVTFSPAADQQLLLVSSWDCKVRLYDALHNALPLSYDHQFPVLDCCFQDAAHAWSCDLGGQLKVFDISSSSESLIGTHDAGIKCVEYCSDVQVLITGSWDQSVKLWDSRASQVLGTYSMPDKVYSMAVCGEKIIVGTAGRRVLIYDLRNMSYVLQRRESSLKYQTRCIRSFPSKEAYVLSSIEGRVAVEFIDPNPEVQKKKFAFKCHRVKESNGMELIYPVNTIAFHSGYSTFATGGSDACVNIWDGFNKKRLCQFHRFPTQISSLAFNTNGSLLAIASSCIYDLEPQKEKIPDMIFIRTVTDQDTKPNSIGFT